MDNKKIVVLPGEEEMSTRLLLRFSLDSNLERDFYPILLKKLAGKELSIEKIANNILQAIDQLCETEREILGKPPPALRHLLCLKISKLVNSIIDDPDTAKIVTKILKRKTN